MVKVMSGRLSSPEQSFGTVMPAVSLSVMSFGPTRSEVPESMTALYPVVSTAVVP